MSTGPFYSTYLIVSHAMFLAVSSVLNTVLYR